MPSTLRALAVVFTAVFPFAGVFLATPARAAQPAPRSPLYVIIPFGEPGDTDPQLANATRELSEDLSDRAVRSALAPPFDAVEAVSNAAQLCSDYRAAGVLVSAIRFEQSKNLNLTGFVPYVGGALSASGAFDRSPIRARYKLFLVDCRGKVTWRTITTSNKIHHGTNVAAGLTQIGSQAIAEAAEQFAARRVQAH